MPDGQRDRSPARSMKIWSFVTPENLGGDLTKNYPDECEAAYQALVLGPRANYNPQCGFERSMIIGLSGGIDSSLTAAIAVGCRQAKKTSQASDAWALSSEHRSLRARHGPQPWAYASNYPHPESVRAFFGRSCRPVFNGRIGGVTEKTCSRGCGGVTLMALSNKWGALVLTTGNKT